MKTICFGEIMLRLSPPAGMRFAQAQSLDTVYGGSEANVAVSLAQLGLSPTFISRVPDNELGRAALGALSQFGVSTGGCVFGGDRLGLYFLEHGAGLRSSKILYDRQHSGMATLCPGMINWQQVLADTGWLHWSGITPALSQETADAVLEALQVASEMKIRISCDINYREKLWKYGKTPADILPELISLTHVLLGDVNAFGLCLGIREEDEKSLLAKVFQQFPQLDHIAMTSRQGISASHNAYRGILFDGRQVYQSAEYELADMVDRIGGGDAFMAGLIFGLQKMPDQPQEIINFAVASAALKHYIKGDFNLTSAQEVRSLMSGNTGGRVNR
jgi:2-dehydro-3-deoxygluconokinase